MIVSPTHWLNRAPDPDCAALQLVNAAPLAILDLVLAVMLLCVVLRLTCASSVTSSQCAGRDFP